MYNKSKLIEHLEQIADLLEFKGENSFKVTSFRIGANAIRQLQDDVETLIQKKTINTVKGIGKSLQTAIEEFYTFGNSALFLELKSEVPAGLFEVFELRGEGPKKIAVLYRELKISNLTELENACKENKIAGLKGFGQKTQDKILVEIDRLKHAKRFLLIHLADRLQQSISNTISKIKGVEEFSITGEYRRTLEFISKLEFVVLLNNYDEFVKQIKTKFDNITINENEIQINGFRIPIVLYLLRTREEYILKLFNTTGSPEFLQKLNLNKITPALSEEKIFKQLGMNFIPPEMREDSYFQYPALTKTASDLKQEKFKGFFHFHTTNSDGNNSLEEMVMAANGLGYNYFAVCDHSKSAFYANGLDENKLMQQKAEIKNVSLKMGLKIFQGIESDILIDGSLDYDKSILSKFDFIVASVHSRFHLAEDEMTNRIIKAIENPYTDVLGHPTGRLLLTRDPYKVNIKKVIDACSSNSVAIEINANPYRLDLEWRNIYYAREKGCLFSINPDAHSVEDINYIKYGINIARKAALQSKEVINCFSLDEFVKFKNRKVKR